MGLAAVTVKIVAVMAVEAVALTTLLTTLQAAMELSPQAEGMPRLHYA